MKRSTGKGQTPWDKEGSTWEDLDWDYHFQVHASICSYYNKLSEAGNIYKAKGLDPGMVIHMCNSRMGT